MKKLFVKETEETKKVNPDVEGENPETEGEEAPKEKKKLSKKKKILIGGVAVGTVATLGAILLGRNRGNAYDYPEDPDAEGEGDESYDEEADYLDGLEDAAVEETTEE